MSLALEEKFVGIGCWCKGGSMNRQELTKHLTESARVEWSFFYNMGIAFIWFDGRKYMAMADSEQQAIEDAVGSALRSIESEAK